MEARPGSPYDLVNYLGHEHRCLFGMSIGQIDAYNKQWEF